jgi:hypothetical protein
MQEDAGCIRETAKIEGLPHYDTIRRLSKDWENKSVTDPNAAPRDLTDRGEFAKQSHNRKAAQKGGFQTALNGVLYA